jgi:putative ABC transport system permease protein
MKFLMNDLRFAFRMLLKNPGFTAVAVLTLALGIGANSALFSLVNKVLLSPLPFPDPERLMFLHATDLANNIEEEGVSGLDYLDWCAGSKSFAAMGAVQFGSKFNLSGRGEPVVLRGVLVTPSFFDVFGIPMRLGREFRQDESEPGKEKVVILSHGLWQRVFGGDSNIIDQTVTLDGEAYVVVGVGARVSGFLEEMLEIYAPLPDAQLRVSRGNHTLTVFGRLKPTASVQQAAAELRTITAAIGLEHPGYKNRSAKVLPLRDRLVREVRPAFLVLYAAVLLVLGIACANVANLLLARGEARRKEIAVRAALGAGRGRIIRQLLTESGLLSLAGALVGLALAQFGLELLRHYAPRIGEEPVPFIDEIEIDGRVLLFTLGVAVLTGILFGLAPAWSAAKVNLMDTLKEASRGSSGTVRGHRLLNSFAVTQLALSVVLLVGAGLLVRSYARLTRVHPGFDARQLLTMETELSHTPYTSGARCLQFYQAVLEAVRTLPTVESAEAINILPMNGRGAGMSFDLEGAEPLPPGRYRMAEYGIVSPGCFQTMRIPLRQGRHLTPADDGQQQVAMVNEEFVRRYLPGVNPLGRRIRQHTGQTNWVEIVGVVADVKDSGLGRNTQPAIYQPFTQTCRSQISLVIRTRGEPTHLARAVQEQIWRIDAAQPVTNVKPMQEWVRQSVSVEQFSARLLLGFALLGLVLAGVGLFGVLAYAVSQRTHEFGVRLAMGAPVGVVLRLVMIQGLKVAGTGLGLGLAGALALTVVLQSLLFEMRAQDPLTFLVVVLVLGLVALAASYLPARRAMNVDPMVALRCE